MMLLFELIVFIIYLLCIGGSLYLTLYKSWWWSPLAVFFTCDFLFWVWVRLL